MNYFNLVLEQIGIFIIYAAIGIICVKCNVLNRNGLNMLSRLITKAVLPLLIFTNTVSGTTREDFFSSLSILVIAIFLYVILFLTARLLSSIARLDGGRCGVYRAGTMFGNCGFMGIPIATALFPERGGMYIAIYTIIDQLMLWTVGLAIASPSDDGALISRQNLSKMLNPAVIAILLGVIFILTGVRLPNILNTALTKTGASATPLAMIYLGGMFCFIHIPDFLKKKEIYFMIFAKMLVLPMAVYFVLSHIPSVNPEIAVTMSLICALPTMSSIAMIAESNHSDSDYAAGMIFVTTLFSCITLPLVCTLF